MVAPCDILVSRAHKDIFPLSILNTTARFSSPHILTQGLRSITQRQRKAYPGEFPHETKGSAPGRRPYHSLFEGSTKKKPKPIHVRPRISARMFQLKATSAIITSRGSRIQTVSDIQKSRSMDAEKRGVLKRLLKVIQRVKEEKNSENRESH